MARTLLDLPGFLRQKRLELELTQKDAAKPLGVSPQLISQWESGERRPSARRLQQLATVYKFDLNELPVSTGSTIPEDEIGNQAIIRSLNDIAESARPGNEHERLVIHSLSTFGFVSSSMSEIAAATCRCADVGVDVVFFCFPSSLGEETTSPASTSKALRESLRRTIVDLKRTGGLSDSSQVAEHFWVISPMDPSKNLDTVAGLYGNLIRILAAIKIVREPLEGAPVTKRPNGVSPSISDWDRIIPKWFELYDLLFHIEELRDGNDMLHRWIRVTYGREHDSRYHLSMKAIRDSGAYELARLFE